MLVIGVDPGTLHLGWGVIETRGSQLVHVAHGVIDVDDALELPARLAVLDDGLRAVLASHDAKEAGVEAIFFAKDASAAAKLGHARGVVLLALQRQGLVIGEYPPATVKRAVTGQGRAEKPQVARMVATVLRLEKAPRADAADALAVAIAHVRCAPARRIAAAAKAAAVANPRTAMLVRALGGRR